MQYETDQLTFKSFDNLCRKSSQHFVIDKSEYESLGNVLTKYVDETKSQSFL